MSEHENGFIIGDFETGFKGTGPVELEAEEGLRQEELSQELDTLLSALRSSGRNELASFMVSLPLDQIQRIDSGLNMEFKGIVDLKWVEPEQQSEVINLLDQVAQGGDAAAVKKACGQIASLVG
jgi:hypothetical protein